MSFSHPARQTRLRFLHLILLAQHLLEVADQITGVFEAYGEAQEAGGCRRLRSFNRTSAVYQSRELDAVEVIVCCVSEQKKKTGK